MLNGNAIASSWAFSVEFKALGISDHNCISVDIKDLCHGIKKPFKFLNVCNNHPGFLIILADCWGMDVQGCAMFSVVTKLKRMKKQFKQLRGHYFRGISEKVKHIHCQLISIQDSLQLSPTSEELRMCEKQMLSDCIKFRKIEEAILTQRAKEHYL